MQERIELTDTAPDVLQKMSEGNPGALTVCIQLMKQGGDIDPDDVLGGLGKVLTLDTLGVYGPRIWMLYKDVCGQSLPRMVALLRGWQLSVVSKAQLRRAIDNRGEGLDVDDVLVQVQKRLPDFWRDTEEIPATSNGRG